MEKNYENVVEAAPKARSEHRDKIDLLRRRLSLLSGKDKLLMTMYWEKGISLRQISRLAGISRTTIARRIHKLTERLMEGEYIACLRNSNRFTKTEMAIAKDYFLPGISMKKIANKQHWSCYRVCKTIKKIQRLLATVSSESSGSRLNNYEN